MPPRKEPKETVVYPASKRKAPPFKPHRPSKVGQTSTTDSESSLPSKSAPRRLGLFKKTAAATDDGEDESDKHNGAEDDSDEELADNPLTARPRPSTKSKPIPPPRRSIPQLSPIHVSDEEDDIHAQLPSHRATSHENEDPAGPSLSDGSPAIPQPLLIRLLHENFADKTTKIDKHAIKVLQKYFEVFVREAIMRTALQKKEDGGTSELDAAWLELEDLEKVAAAMLLDF
jgi:hypothetical protein